MRGRREREERKEKRRGSDGKGKEKQRRSRGEDKEKTKVQEQDLAGEECDEGIAALFQSREAWGKGRKVEKQREEKSNADGAETWVAKRAMRALQLCFKAKEPRKRERKVEEKTKKRERKVEKKTKTKGRERRRKVEENRKIETWLAKRAMRASQLCFSSRSSSFFVFRCVCCTRGGARASLHAQRESETRQTVR